MTAKELKPLISREQLIEMYSRYPGALEEDVAQVFLPLHTPEAVAAHNVAVKRILRLVRGESDDRQMWSNVARAIVNTAVQLGENTDGKT